MRLKRMILLGLMGLTHAVLAKTLTIEPRGNEFGIIRDGQEIGRVWADLGAAPLREVKHAYEKTSAGAQAWNCWCEESLTRFRLEAGKRADGALEFTMSGEMKANSPYRVRRMVMRLNQTSAAMKVAETYNWLTIDGLTFDFDPLGLGNEGGASNIAKTWKARKLDDGAVEFVGGEEIVKPLGGWCAAKLVIREGVCDYDQVHAFRRFVYREPLAVERNLHFGSTSGTLYKAERGEGKREVTINELADGYHILTVAAGNFEGADNEFSIFANGEAIATGVRIGKQRARSIAKVVHVKGGKLQVALVGKYRLSQIGVQPLLFDGEDFSFGRCFWLADGYEPTHAYRNADDKGRQAFAVSDQDFFMPVPGEEAKELRPVKDWVAPSRELPDRKDPVFDWMDNARIFPLLFNRANFAEVEDRQVLSDKLDELIGKKNINLVMLSGCLSRHTYPAHEDRQVEAVRLCSEELHRRGIKVIDHHDTTLCWNEGSGFRVLAERLDQSVRMIGNGLPSFQLCLENPDFNRYHHGYLRRMAQAGVDGFQLDEVQFWAHSCVCAHCRERFHKDTGGWLPVDGDSWHFHDRKSPIYRAWVKWRIARVAEWSVNVRRALKDINDKLILGEYATHVQFLRNMPAGLDSQDLFEVSARAINLPGTEIMCRNPYVSHRSMVPRRKLFNIIPRLFGSPLYGWYYGADARIFYFNWALATMLGQAALLLDEDFPRTAEVPDYLAFAGSKAAMRRKGAAPIAEVAVMFSRASRDWSPNDDKAGIADSTHEMLGIAQELEAMHVPYEMITDQDLDCDNLAKYKTIFLGDCACISEAGVAALKAFVRRGGKLQMTAKAGIADEEGALRKEWPFEGVAKADVQFGARKREFPQIDPRAKAFNPQEFDDSPGMRNLVQKKMAPFVSGAKFWQTDAPEGVYLMPWKEADGAIVIHILNATGAQKLKKGDAIPWQAPKEAFPKIGRDLHIAMNAALLAGRKVVAVSPDFAGERELKVEGRTIVLPNELLTAYTLIRIK